LPLLVSVFCPEILEREYPPTILPPSFVSATQVKKSKLLPPKSFWALITGCAKPVANKINANRVVPSLLFKQHFIRFKTGTSLLLPVKKNVAAVKTISVIDDLVFIVKFFNL